MIGEVYQRILTKGKLCMSTDNKLYIGSTLVATEWESFITCEVVEYGTVSNVLNKPVCFTLPDNVYNVKVIYDNILKPFSDSKVFDKFQKSIDWFCCINEFVSFDKLFMYVLKQKYDKDYSKFMELCKSNVDKINWNAQDSDGNTMLHYVTIMNKYPEIACDIIQHIKETCKYLLNKGNKKGVIPLASILYDKFICEHTKEANTDIIRGLINAGANLLLKTDTYVWKGKDDLMFCVLTRDPETLLLSSKFATKTNDGTYRICCSLEEPPGCQLYSATNLTLTLPKNLLALVLKFPCIQIHRILLTNNHCSLTSKMPDGTPCMHYIVEYGSKELVEVMFDRGLDSSFLGTNVNKNTDFSLLDESNNSILHTAICKRKTDNAVVILKRCSDKTLNVMLETQNFSKETPLDLAIKTELFSLITSLNHYRPEIFIEIFRTFDSAGNFWFHRAVRDKSKELLKVLIEQENLADYIDSENAKQYTPLMQCVREKFVEGFKILEKTRKCRIDVHDRESYTLLHLAIIYYEKEIFSELLQVIASDNKLRQMIDRRVEIPTIRYIPSSQYHGLTPLLLSLRCQQFVAARLLLENGANINTLDCEGRTFNSYLIETCRDENELDSFFTNTVVTACIHNDVSSLSLSVQYSNEAVFDLLIPKCDLDMIAYQDDSQNTVLSLILSNVKYTRFLKPLLSRLDVFYRDETKRAKLSQIIDKQNKKGETPLSISIISGNSQTVSKLLALGCYVTENILHLATKHGDIQMVTCILDKITEVQSNEMLSTYIKDQTPLHIAISLNKVEILKKFLSMDVDLTKQDTEVSILLNLAIEHGEKTFQTLFEYFRKKDDQFLKNCLEIRNPSEPSKIINMQDEEGKTVLHHCIESIVYNKERLSLLLATNPDLTLVDSKSNNILHYAVNCKVELLKALITHIKDKSLGIIIYLLSQQNVENNTPLYCAIQMKNIPCVDEFLKVNAAPLPVIQVDGTVTLCNRQPYPHTKVPMCLYDVKLKDKPDLHICVGFELSDKQWILSDLPKLSCTYLTPVISSYSQYQRVSKIPNDSIDESLLESNLLSCHCYEPLELVIDSLKDLKFTNEARLMHLAASCGTIQIVEYLIELYGADIPFSDLDNKRYSIIHYSIENKETQILRILCERMKRDHPQDFTELSGKLLQFCITENHFEAFKILLEMQYSANSAYTDTHGDTLLHLIVLHSRNVGYVRELLECPQLVASEFCNIVNKSSNTALHLAINKKDRIIVTEILKHNPDISIHDSNGNTALQLAIQNSTIDIIKDIMGFWSMNINIKKPDAEVSILLNLAIKHGEKTFQTVFEHFRKKDDQFLKNCLEIHSPKIPHCVIHSINLTNLLALTTLIEYNESYKDIIYGNLPLLHYAITKQFVEGVKYLISLGLPLATHNSEQNLTLHSDTLKLRLVFTDSKVGYKLGSGYVLTDIPNLERTEYFSSITAVRNISVLFQNLVECKISEPLQQYISIHTSSLPSYIAQLSMRSSKYGTLQLMEYLLNSNNAQKCIFDVDSTESDGNTVVHNGIYNPCIQSFSLLLDHLNKINTQGWIFAGTKHIDRLNNQKYSPLELSMKEYKKEAFLTLRQHGASYATKGSGQNILHRYITCNITDISYLDLILEDLSQQNSEIINEYNSTGYTPLHTAVSAGNTLVYSKLMTLTSCNYDIVSKSEGNNIVHLAIQKRKPELLKLILEDLKNREKDTEDENRLINRENAKHLTPQFLAVEEGNIDLILNMPELSGVSADGTNLLHHAVKCSDKSPKHLEMIKTIITKKEGMVNAGDKFNETPLHYAVKLPRESAVRKLLECPSIDFSCQNNNGKTALHLAIHSNTNILKLLLNAIDKQ